MRRCRVAQLSHGLRDSTQVSDDGPTVREHRTTRMSLDAGVERRTGVSRRLPSVMINEILVDVGRDGELLLVDGRHRLSIVKILGLDEIPVVKHVRHEQWVARRTNDRVGDASGGVLLVVPFDSFDAVAPAVGADVIPCLERGSDSSDTRTFHAVRRAVRPSCEAF